MFSVTSSNIALGSDTGDCDDYTFGSDCPSSHADDADEASSSAESKDFLEKRDELNRMREKHLAAARARRLNRQVGMHNVTLRDGGRTKHRWSTVRLAPRGKSVVDGRMQKQAAISKPAATPSSVSAPETWPKNPRAKKLKEEREHAQHLQHPTMAFTAGGSGRRNNTRTEQVLSNVQSASKHFGDTSLRPGVWMPPHLRTAVGPGQGINNTRTEQMLSTVESAIKHFGSFTPRSGGYLPPHLRNRRVKSSESKLTFATGDHGVPMAIERKEPRNKLAKLSERALRSDTLPSTYVHDQAEAEINRAEMNEANISACQVNAPQMKDQPVQWNSRRRGPITSTYDTFDFPSPSRKLPLSTALKREVASSYSEQGSKARAYKLETERTATAQICESSLSGSSATYDPQPELQHKEESCTCGDGSWTPCSIHSGHYDGWADFDTFLNWRRSDNGASAWTCDNHGNGWGSANDSDDIGSGSPVPVTDTAEGLENRMLERFGDDDSTHPRALTPDLIISASTSAGQEARQDHATSSDETEAQLSTAAKITTEEEKATEFLKPPPASDAHLSSPDKESLGHAWDFLELQRYRTVDYPTLKQHLNRVLSRNHADYVKVVTAFTRVVEHQDGKGCWVLSLRWCDNLDQELLQYVVDGQLKDCVGLAHQLHTTEEDCLQRWEQIKPKDTSPPHCRPNDSDHNLQTSSKGWNAELDEKLMRLRNSFPTPSWLHIARKLDVDKKDAKRRFREIKPKGWKPKTKTQARKDAKSQASARTTPTAEIPAAPTIEHNSEIVSKAGSDEVASLGVASGWGVASGTAYLGCGCAADDWCDCNVSDPTAADTPPSTAAASEQHAQRMSLDVSPLWCDGESTPLPGNEETDAASNNNRDDNKYSGFGNDVDHPSAPCVQCGQVRDCWCEDNANVGHTDDMESPSQPEPGDFPAYTVTYWAMIESGDEQIHVPIQSKDVSGPEKRIVDGGMQKVWKWVHDKGLSDKIGLQDAFDLAQSMHETDDVKEPSQSFRSHLGENMYDF
ncbi:hypothetical protein EJ07DRAFT_152370 [Lizonia empirigonia]|nr:hypothetical protein EJ07DRAFT_152370 [Lizonia empirigonia]